MDAGLNVRIYLVKAFLSGCQCIVSDYPISNYVMKNIKTTRNNNNRIEHHSIRLIVNKNSILVDQ